MSPCWQNENGITIRSGTYVSRLIKLSIRHGVCSRSTLTLFQYCKFCKHVRIARVNMANDQERDAAAAALNGKQISVRSLKIAAVQSPPLPRPA